MRAPMRPLRATPAGGRALAARPRLGPSARDDHAGPEDLIDLGAVTAWPRESHGLSQRWRP